MQVYDRECEIRCVISPTDDLLQKSKSNRLYRASLPNEERMVFARVANQPSDNAVINREAELLRYLQSTSEDVEMIYQEHTKSDQLLHYDWLFPQLEDSFICDDTQSNRQINLFFCRDASLDQFIPMVKLRQAYMIDAKTVAWIMGRFLKLQNFLEDICTDVTYKFNPGQIILAPADHRMVCLKCGEDSPTATAEEMTRQNIQRAAKYMLEWLKTDGTEGEDAFAELLTSFASDGRTSAESAHREFYSTIHGLWGRKYHPFTYYDTEHNVWRQKGVDFSQK